MLALFTHMEDILRTDEHFLLGRWVEEARSWAAADAPADFFEFNALNQVTLWGPRGEITDYASKQWSGLMQSYYRPRWALYLRTALAAANRSECREAFVSGDFESEVFERVEKPFQSTKRRFPTRASGDPLLAARTVYDSLQMAPPAPPVDKTATKGGAGGGGSEHGAKQAGTQDHSVSVPGLQLGDAVV